MAIITVYTKLLDKSLDGARIIDMGSTRTCLCYVIPYDEVAKISKEYLNPHCSIQSRNSLISNIWIF